MRAIFTKIISAFMLTAIAACSTTELVHDTSTQQLYERRTMLTATESSQLYVVDENGHFQFPTEAVVGPNALANLVPAVIGAAGLITAANATEPLQILNQVAGATSNSNSAANPNIRNEAADINVIASGGDGGDAMGYANAQGGDAVSYGSSAYSSQTVVDYGDRTNVNVDVDVCNPAGGFFNSCDYSNGYGGKG